MLKPSTFAYEFIISGIVICNTIFGVWRTKIGVLCFMKLTLTDPIKGHLVNV